MSNNAIELINYLGQQSDAANLADIRKNCHIPPTTLTRLLNSLQKDGYVEKVSHGSYRLCHGRLNSIRGQSRRSHVVLAISPGTHEAAVTAIERTLSENDFSISLRYIQEYSIEHIDNIFRMERHRPDYMVTFFEESIPQTVLDWLQTENIQLINSGYYGHLQVPTISSDFSSGSEVLCQHIINHGHKDILYIGREHLVKNNINFRARLEGYQRIIMRQQLNEHSWLIDNMLFSQADVDQIIKQRLDDSACTAIICEYPGILSSLCNSLQRLKISIPNDISIACINNEKDTGFFHVHNCELCHVREPWSVFGNAVAMHIQSQERHRDELGRAAPRTLSLVPMPFTEGSSICRRN
ncbi:MAG: substrate-binding domain-containing protein [Planctomycetes bacterium]|nr:substrate-binding domain-containing protein [Planctomycetota bacterium]